MKKYPSLVVLLLGSLLTSLLFAGCAKNVNTKPTPQEEEQAARTSGEAETELQFSFDVVFNNVMGVSADVGTGGAGVFSRSADAANAKTDSAASCVSVSITPLQTGVFPKTVVLDFGTGCYSHGHLRSGKMTTVYTGRLTEPGSSATTSFDNFKFDSVTVQGTHKITNTTASGSTQRQFKVEVTSAKLTKPNGNYTEWTAVRTITQTEGNGTISALDDVFRISGTSSGTAKRELRQVSWTSETGEPLLKQFTCAWFSKGTIKTVRNGLTTSTPWVVTLDFGNGTCDNQASLTFNGNVYQITLH